MKIVDIVNIGTVVTGDKHVIRLLNCVCVCCVCRAISYSFVCLRASAYVVLGRDGGGKSSQSFDGDFNPCLLFPFPESFVYEDPAVVYEGVMADPDPIDLENYLVSLSELCLRISFSIL